MLFLSLAEGSLAVGSTVSDVSTGRREPALGDQDSSAPERSCMPGGRGRRRRRGFQDVRSSVLGLSPGLGGGQVIVVLAATARPARVVSADVALGAGHGAIRTVASR